jgi:anaerobic magnesium-protoporphyrin IX monomethyl ester cyclase
MNKGKVLMIVHDRYQEDNFINLGLAYIGAYLLQYGSEVVVYDMAIYHHTNQQLAEYLKKNSFDLILVSFLSGRFIQTVYPLCKIINEYKKNAWLCLGGHGASPMPQYMIEKTNCEIVCTGEGEEIYPEILECKLNGKSLYNVKGIAFKDNNKIIINQHRRPIIKLDTIPFPAWDLFDMNIYTNNIKLSGMDEKDKCFALISSRGCTHRCSFCYRMENGIRIRSIDNVIKEIKILHDKYGITYFFFFDELFVYTKKRIIEFARALEKNNLNIMYSVNCRVDIFDEEIAQILKNSGCMLNNIGFESTSQEVLNAMGKQVKIEQNYKAAEICKKIGLGMGLNTLWGLPKDSIQTLKNNAQFVKDFNLYEQCRIIKPVVSYPGTPLLTEAVKRGFIKKEEEFFDYFKNSDLIMFNFMDISLNEAYQALFEVNSDLIIDHYKHTNNDMIKANELIEGLRKLYFENKYDFYGVRSDSTNEDKRKIIK